MPTKIIAIATHKGGAGKTVTAMGLSAALARAGNTCLLVDLDPQGHCALGLGVEINDGEPTTNELFSEPPLPAAKIIRDTRVPGLKLLPSHIRLSRLAPSLYMRPKREGLLKRALEPIQDAYNFIVVDCPPALDALTQAGIGAADFILIPCQMEARAADGLVDLLELIGLIKNEHFDDWRIVLTRVDSRKSATNQAVIAALEQWSSKILNTKIPQSEPLNQAQIERTDIFSFEPKSTGAVAYEGLAQEILTYGK